MRVCNDGMRVSGAVSGGSRVACAVLGEAAEVSVPAKGFPVVAGLVGVIAPMVALSGLVPAVASPVLLAVGVMAALALSRGEPGGPRSR
jgi:hypothetical protein